MSTVVYTLCSFLRTGNPLADALLVAVLVAGADSLRSRWHLLPGFWSKKWSVMIIAQAETSWCQTNPDFAAFASFVAHSFPCLQGKVSSAYLSGIPYDMPTDQQTFTFRGSWFKYSFAQTPAKDSDRKTQWNLTISTLSGIVAIKDLLRHARENQEGQKAWESSAANHDGKGVWSARRVIGNHSTFDNVVLKDGLAEEIKQDVDCFMAEKDWYVSKGLPYKRGFLFHGPPGTGKSSLVRAISNHTRRDIYSLNLGCLGGDEELRTAIQGVPAKALIVLEDIDCMRYNLDRNAKGEADEAVVEKGPTLSGLLNFLDGINSN